MTKSRVKAIKVLSSVIRQGSDEAMVQQDGVAMVAPSSPIVRRKVNGGNFDGDKRGDGSGDGHEVKDAKGQLDFEDLAQDGGDKEFVHQADQGGNANGEFQGLMAEDAKMAKIIQMAISAAAENSAAASAATNAGLIAAMQAMTAQNASMVKAVEKADSSKVLWVTGDMPTSGFDTLDIDKCATEDVFKAIQAQFGEGGPFVPTRRMF